MVCGGCWWRLFRDCKAALLLVWLLQRNDDVGGGGVLVSDCFAQKLIFV